VSTKLVKTVSMSVAVLLACALIYAFVINRPDPPDVDHASVGGRGSRRPASRDLLFDGVTVEGRQGGERTWMLSAVRVETGAGDGWAEMYEITEGQIYRNGRAHLTFSAGRGVYDRRTGQLRLDGGVKVASDGKDLLATDEVVWDPKQSRVLIPGKTEIATSAGVVTVGKLEVDIAADKMHTAGDVLVKEAEGQRSFCVEGDDIRFSSDGESFEARGKTTVQFELDDSED
jgi:phage baseplate assembly protein gpV